MQWSAALLLLAACVTSPAAAPPPVPPSDIPPELACAVHADCVQSCEDTCCRPSCGCGRVVNRETAERERATKGERCSAEELAECQLHPCIETLMAFPRCNAGRCEGEVVARTI